MATSPHDRLVRELVRLSRDGDRVSSERVEAVLTALRNRPPAGYREVVRLYRAAIARALQLEEVVIESAGPLSEETVADVVARFSASAGRSLRPVLKVRPDLLAGIRVRVGDDVWDASASGALSRLERAARIA